MRKERNRGFVPVGVCSLLVIFAVLCLTVFALLSVSTVLADRTLSERSALAAENYYRADCAAEETLARLRAGERPEEVSERAGVFTYTHPIGDTQILVVSVRVDGTQYEILRWQAVSTTEWQADERLPVWDGEKEEGTQ